MSEITDGINRIRLYLAKNYSDIAESWQPGLNIQEIRSRTQYLSFELSDEVSELLQYISIDKRLAVFARAELYDLNTALKIYEDFADSSLNDELKAFPLFFSEDYQEYWFAICDNSENKPIIAIGFDDPELVIR